MPIHSPKGAGDQTANTAYWGQAAPLTEIPPPVWTAVQILSAINLIEEFNRFGDSTAHHLAPSASEQNFNFPSYLK